MKDRIFKLHGKAQNYAWGGFEYISDLFGLDKNKNRPVAEYWMGAHPSASSMIEVDGNMQSLQELIQQSPNDFIGGKVHEKFGELPYLFKVLDVREMLSIQVHPTKEEALKGFEAEEAKGVPINAPHRNYKDKNHKPEVMIALSEFWLLHGFKKEDELRQTLQATPEFNFLLPIFQDKGYKGLYKEVMELPQPKVDEILLPLVQREMANKKHLQKNEPGYWVNKLYNEGDESQNLDRGIFSIYFFNIVQVQRDEAVFQGAGIPHAYLEGQNIELMANSDNVLRGGLTPKHVDVPELLKHTKFEAVIPTVLKGELINDYERNYSCPIEDFGISIIVLNEGERYATNTFSGEIFLVLDGAVQDDETGKRFTKGEAFYVLPQTDLTIVAKEKATMYKAFVPEIG